MKRLWGGQRDDDTERFDGSTDTARPVDEGRVQYQTGRYHRVLLPEDCSAEVDRIEEAIARAALEEVRRKQAAIEATAAATDEKVAGAIFGTKTGTSGNQRPVTLPAWARTTGVDLRQTTPPGFLHRLLNNEAVEDARATSQSRQGSDSDRELFLTHLYELLTRIGENRRLARVGPGWRSELDAISHEMPNFKAVVRYLRSEIMLAEAAGMAPCFAPILLNGPPGVGKTVFARRLAEFLASGFLSISMETAQTSSALSGSESFWANSKPGEFFALMTQGEFANPVVLLDEIDKVGGDRYNPAAALYSLLEPAAAATWHDLSVPELPLDVSRVTWILTSNALDTITSPLRSRMKLFTIPPLTVAQSREMAMRIFRQVVANLDMDFSPELPIPMAAVLATISPREMHRLSREVVANAVATGRRQVEQADLAETDIDELTLNQWKIVADQVAAAESEQHTKTKLH